MSMRSAFRKAGVNTAAIELQQKAIEAMKLNGGDIVKASKKLWRVIAKSDDLGEELTAYYLLRLDPLLYRAAAPRPVGVKFHRRHKSRAPRTQEDRDAEMRVTDLIISARESGYNYRVGGRPIGDIRWGELLPLAKDEAFLAAGHIRAGTQEAIEAILSRNLHNYAEVNDHSRLVRDVINEVQLEKLIKDAQVEALQKISQAMHAYAHTLLSVVVAPAMAQ